jgi:catechol 2,3-dioxygenase-like lactoylglutathione lyase family enzyme
VQLALNVTDIDTAVEFYSTLFGTPPSKRRPGYANFAIAEPPLKLVLIETTGDRSGGVVGALNHLGVEVETPGEVADASRRLADAGLVPRVQESTTCCYAVQDKAWVSDPDGAPWEVYAVLADAVDATGMGCSVETCGPAAGQPVVTGGAASGEPTAATTPTQPAEVAEVAAPAGCC